MSLFTDIFLIPFKAAMESMKKRNDILLVKGFSEEKNLPNTKFNVVEKEKDCENQSK
jgi:hypothetical protein